MQRPRTRRVSLLHHWILPTRTVAIRSSGLQIASPARPGNGHECPYSEFRRRTAVDLPGRVRPPHGRKRTHVQDIASAQFCQQTGADSQAEIAPRPPSVPGHVSSMADFLPRCGLSTARPVCPPRIPASNPRPESPFRRDRLPTRLLFRPRLQARFVDRVILGTMTNPF